jgi:phosphohistidine phosphatase
MKLYIVRHAIAFPHGTPGVRDDDRTLTEEGMNRMRKAAAGLRNLGYVPDLLLSSPLIRARQTADILLEEFGKGVEVKITPALAPSGSRQNLYRQISQIGKKRNSLMLVGHQPSLGEIAGEIAWGSPDHFVDLKKGGACAIEIESVEGIPRGTLISLLPPSILRKILD